MMHHRNLLLWISISTAASVQINPRENTIDAKRSDAINTNNLKQRRLQSSSSCEPTQTLWTLSLTTDQNPEETSWRLVQLESIYYEASIDPENPDYADIVTQQGAARKGKVIASGPPKSSGGNETSQYYAPETTYTGSLCLDGGYIYITRMKDAGGDGLGSVSDGNEDGTPGWSVIVSTDNGDGSDEFFEAFGNDAANFKTKDFEFIVDSKIVTTVEPTASPMTKVPTAATAEPMVAINGTESPTKAPTASTNEPTTKKPTASPTAGLTDKVSTGPETVVSFIVMGDGTLQYFIIIMISCWKCGCIHFHEKWWYHSSLFCFKSVRDFM